MSNNTEFKWDDASVLEFVQFTLKNSPLLQGRYTDLQQFKESKQPKELLFTTEDRVDIYKDYSGRISAVYEDFSFNYDCPIEFILSERETPHTFTIKYFSTKEAATNFILDNKPLLSLKEIREVGHAEKHNHYYKKLVALAESKLK